MKFSINRVELTKRLNLVSRAISSKTTIPILTGLKLKANSSELVLTGSNADISIENKILSEDNNNMLTVVEPGSVVLPARFFTGIVKKLPEDLVTIEVNEDNLQTVIKSGAASFTINGLNAEDYPHLPEIDTNNAIELKGDIFKEMISQTVIAVSNQESRPILTGVHFVLNNAELMAVATDSHRLSQRKIKLPEIDEGKSYDLIIPGSSLSELSKMISENNETVKMSVSENQVLFIVGQNSFYSRLLEGNYPDTSRLIPDTSTTTIEFDNVELLGAIERASILSHESRNNVVKLTINPADEIVKISGNSPDVGNVEEKLDPKKIDGNELEISFNPDYMKDAVRAFGKSIIKISFTSSLRPFTLLPTEDSENFIELITPVRTF
ncbi:DNA-directed DNA polymerase III, beta chain [Apilactobacillus ozensis DSM 23829 = JCM 17196]|uniref:Beta sliding clamp n=1 Tax=Apilactobacillus ozensis DSM 23829 = JCM 17196 TaxID=1423781 RepID=A0A0R2AVN0_9LACO|nr:DNA polymerase III subunit beta [Apilactobacillus ozensis]KRM69572.1 DNA-directed DNA polymerase III, beta chain [Apilactobacillus ozensis DSM 23829 = JCM 17196]